MKRIMPLSLLTLLIVTYSCDLEPTRSVPDTTHNYTNPLVPKRADPSIYYHTDGYYYLATTEPIGGYIQIRKARSLQGLIPAIPVTVWDPLSTAYVWSPELRYYNGKWYLYAAAGNPATTNIRIAVREGTGADPMMASWADTGQSNLTTATTRAHDPAVADIGGVPYVFWSEYSAGGTAELYVATLNPTSPWLLSSAKVLISTPTLSWELVTAGVNVNEGPSVLVRNGKVFVIYSANNRDKTSCLGMLTASESSNLLSAGSWTKSSQPVFSSSTANLVFGPGHSAFTREAGSDIMLYHARRSTSLFTSAGAVTTDPLVDANRGIMAKAFGWNGDGTPNFGVPR